MYMIERNMDKLRKGPKPRLTARVADLRLAPVMLECVDKLADQAGITRSAWIRQAIDERLKRDQRKRAKSAK